MPPHSKVEALAMRLRRRCALSFGETRFKRDRAGAVKESEFSKMDVHYGTTDVEVSAPYRLHGLIRPKPGQPVLEGAWTFTLNGKGAPRGQPYSPDGHLPLFQQRETTWRVHIYITRQLEVFYRVEFGLPPNVGSLVQCAMGGL
jgi:hypothetical protein